ncbi:YveK family protein [Clostridium perfringens]|nr:GNVR domain-containing protein [Clostridium perfringens]MCX0420638.1 capsular biosynthesis protein [Clostridium perfringens]
MYRRLVGTYSEIMKSEDLIINVIESKNLNLNSEEVYKKLKVIPRDETQIIEISYRDIDKERGLTLINGIINDFTEKSKELIPNGNVQVIEKAKLPTKPVSPNKFLNIFIAFILGIVFSIGLILVLDFFDNTIKTREDIENDIGLILIGDIPEIRGNDIKNLKEELKE